MLTFMLAMMADNIEHVISYWLLYQKFHSTELAGFAVVSHCFGLFPQLPPSLAQHIPWFIPPPTLAIHPLNHFTHPDLFRRPG
jgi:hypothetical protein